MNRIFKVRALLRLQVAFLLLVGHHQVLAQTDVLAPADSLRAKPHWHQTKAFRTLAAPTVLIAYGTSVIGENGYVISSQSVKERLQLHFLGLRTRVDDLMPGLPAAAVYGFSLAGVKGKHDFVDQAIIGALSYGLMISTVSGLKAITRIQRPDLTTYNSFPSAHTATAFMSAELLHQEYGERSGWYSVGGYTIASATGVLRMLNNRHWLSDVFVGAGVGMLSTKAIYLVYPVMQEKVFSRISPNLGLVPTYTGGGIGVVAVYIFK
jgi:membrane-associated phospholipid phosphatase